MTPGIQDYYRLRQWLEQQERRLAEVEAENRELRRQLDELRRGVGVSVVIQGCTIPVAAGPVAQMPYVEATFQQSQPGHPQRQPAFPEETWLTGHGPAARPVSPPNGVASGVRARTPASQVTPEWLCDGSTDTNKQNVRPSRQIQPSTSQARAYLHQNHEASPDSEASYSPGSGTYRRPAPRQEAILSLEDIPTLAQITGAQPSAGVPRRQQRTANPYEDSFVLD